MYALMSMAKSFLFFIMLTTYFIDNSKNNKKNNKYVNTQRWPNFNYHYNVNKISYKISYKISNEKLNEGMNNKECVIIDYTNYRGESGCRVIMPIEKFFGINEFHPGEQWLIRATDVEKNAERVFAMKDIHS